MADIVVSGQKFKIAGEQPTAQEQLAIDTFLGARNFEDEKTGSSILDNDEFAITPEESGHRKLFIFSKFYENCNRSWIINSWRYSWSCHGTFFWWIIISIDCSHGW